MFDGHYSVRFFIGGAHHGTFVIDEGILITEVVHGAFAEAVEQLAIALTTGQDEVVGDLDVLITVDQNRLHGFHRTLTVVFIFNVVDVIRNLHLFHLFIQAYVMLGLRKIAQLGETVGKCGIGLLLAERNNAEREFLDRHGLLEECDGFFPLLICQGLLTVLQEVVKNIVLKRDIIADFG